MKKVLIIPFLIFWLFSEATHYYFSNAGNDGNAGTSPGASRRTIGKFNTMTFSGDDTISFNGGDIFNDAKMKLPSSGTSGHTIVINSYGTGKAYISGWTSISSGSWTSDGNGKYHVSVGSLSSCNMVTLDGYFKAMGKFPTGNDYFNATSTGHANTADQDTINSASTSTNNSIAFSTCPTLTNPSAQVVWRAFHWVLWRGPVTGKTSSAIYYKPEPSTSGGGTEQPQSTYGFFVQNDSALCSSLGDWAYDSSAHKLFMDFPSGPTGHTVQVATSDTLIDVNGKNFVTFDNISIQGANSYLVYGCGGTNVTFKNSFLGFAGIYGVFGNCTPTSWAFQVDSIREINSVGLRQNSGSTGWSITDCIIDSIGAVAGMGGSGENQYFGIQIKSSCDIERNFVTNCGYLAIDWDGPSCTIQNNFVNNYCFIKDDGGGIYNSGQLTANCSGTIINSNIIINGIGAKKGTPDTDPRAHGIYVDDGASQFTIQNNTMAFMGDAGIYCHGCNSMTISSNTIYNTGLNYGEITVNNDNGLAASVTSKHNIFFAKDSSELLFYSTNGAQPTAWYTPDSNYYDMPINKTKAYMRQDANFRTFSAWQTYISGDSHSVETPKTITTTSDIRFEYNASGSTINISAGGFKYIDAQSNIYSGTISIPAWSSLVLIKNGTISGLFFKR